jgi:hypothetical protein
MLPGGKTELEKKIDESKNKDVKDSSDLAHDNQLKTAVDILKSWGIMGKNLNN